MEENSSINKNKLLKYLIENSIFTERQISIIYERKHKTNYQKKKRGTYYRILKQSKDNIKRVYYSMLLLEVLGVLDDEKKSILTKLSKNVNVACDINDERINDVINVISEIINRLSKI